MKNDPLFYCYSTLIRFWFMQIRGFVTSQSSDVKSQKIKYLCKYSGLKFCRVDVLQELLQCGYYVTRATYSSPDLYLLKTKNLSLHSLTDFLVLCNVHIRLHPLNDQQEQITPLEGGKRWFYPLNGESPKYIVLPWKPHSGYTMELCDECNNCTKFQFYTKNVLRDIFLLYITLCPHCDVTSPRICKNQTIE